ncbi:hypothetical protein BCR41DRAFT_399329 [Lobosporangium transversale]|uniref:Uncharacterized protein n=1 Tax=Lobosporangium transversale TaxID=64571 RepID=A0A1Y2GFR7_9FUNG|nr:hypothetical protein BCR41DRAFT_399329 [Lobosporangium transversale]ORZ08266.1 hypothetical protein BCR41DRAFT_399329 [Lobosporangium transversale]|eukprot:XP_021878349.1 hypothetical protein BCR41DRAFT_399329 [Lobosporangium transversale]
MEVNLDKDLANNLYGVYRLRTIGRVGTLIDPMTPTEGAASLFLQAHAHIHDPAQQARLRNNHFGDSLMKACCSNHIQALSSTGIVLSMAGASSKVSQQGIIIESRASGLKKTSEVHPAHESLHNNLLHPKGEDWTYKKYKKWPRPGQTSAGPHGDSYDGSENGQLEVDVGEGDGRARKSREYAKLEEFYTRLGVDRLQFISEYQSKLKADAYIEDLATAIKKIVDQFFAPSSSARNFLEEYVRDHGELPVTTEGVKGLPRISRRGKPLAPMSRPSLLFLDLPASYPDDLTPNRFRSNVILNALDNTASRDVPVFGVSGCGKTRSVIEVLCLQWGFYFNASDRDLGSDDLSSLSASILDKTQDDDNKISNTESNIKFAKRVTLLLFLSRLLILNFCLSVPGCRQTFPSARWAILQVCPNMFEDVFMRLFKILYDTFHDRNISIITLTAVTRMELISAREHLLDLQYPNFTRKSKLRLVVDEAQILSDQGTDKFDSSSQGKLRPMLSPILHGFRLPDQREELTVIYCGTGLSIQLYIGPWAVQMDQLQDEESKKSIDILLPSEAVDMLYQRLTGRFRPVVLAIEEIIRAGQPNKWENAIDTIEKKEFVLDDQAQLVEAALGRIRMLGGKAKTVLDEPFVLKSAINYSKEIDPLFMSAAEQAILHTTNAQAHRSMWETMMPAFFIETFKTKPLSSWPLLPNNWIPEQLSGDVKIVGYNDQDPRLAITYKDITLQGFLDVHLSNTSNLHFDYTPPFYFPSPNVSAPDVVFLVQIQSVIYPVFVQSKLRQVIPKPDADQAITTTSIAVIAFQTFRPDADPELSGLQRVVIKVDNNNFPSIFPERHVKFLDKLKNFKRRA